MNLNYKKIINRISFICVFGMLSYIAIRDISIIDIILYPFIFNIIYMAILFIHEISHFLTALACKANIIRLEVKSIEIKKINKKWNACLKRRLNRNLSYEGCLFLKCDTINDSNEFEKCKRRLINISLGGVLSTIITFIVTLIVHKYFANNIWTATLVLLSGYFLVSVVLGDLLMVYFMLTSHEFCLYIMLESEIISNSIEDSDSKEYIIEQIIERLSELKNNGVASDKLNNILLCYNKLLIFSLSEGKKYISDDIFYYIINELYKITYEDKTFRTNVQLNENSDIVMNSILYCRILNDDIKANELIHFAKQNNIFNLNEMSISNLLVKELLNEENENKMSQIIERVNNQLGSYKHLYMNLINQIMRENKI